MAMLFMLHSKPIKSIICFYLLATTFWCGSSARILEDITPQVPLPADNPNVAPVVAPAATLPSGQLSATTATPATPAEPEPAAPIVAPAADTPDVEPPSTTNPPPVANKTPSGAVNSYTTAPPANAIRESPPLLSFFMHDVLGGSHPSGRVVTGIVANSDANNLPFSKANNQIFPINGGVPLNTINGAINNNNFPFLIGLNGSPNNNQLLQNSGNNNIVNGGNNQAFVTAGQLPTGLTLQQLMFGSITVVDNEITEGHELGSSVLGKAQGFYMVSSSDGSSHTLALTAMFHGEDHEVDDTISFFGIHRTATPISHIAIVGGTSEYENAKGYATIETLPHEDQHTTDGLETITHFTVYLTPKILHGNYDKSNVGFSFSVNLSFIV